MIFVKVAARQLQMTSFHVLKCQNSPTKLHNYKSMRNSFGSFANVMSCCDFFFAVFTKKLKRCVRK